MLRLKCYQDEVFCNTCKMMLQPKCYNRSYIPHFVLWRGHCQPFTTASLTGPVMLPCLGLNDTAPKQPCVASPSVPPRFDDAAAATATATAPGLLHHLLLLTGRAHRPMVPVQARRHVVA
jgi:hypothetical protein